MAPSGEFLSCIICVCVCVNISLPYSVPPTPHNLYNPVCPLENPLSNLCWKKLNRDVGLQEKQTRKSLTWKHKMNNNLNDAIQQDLKLLCQVWYKNNNCLELKKICC